MPTRYYAQRQHLVNSLDTLVYQLFTVSFLMSPSILIYLSRMLIQFQCARPREIDPTYPLRFFFGLVLACNAIVFYTHASQGASEGRALVIDFIGMSYAPSRLQLLSLDFFIVSLQLLITTISYETQLYHTSTDADIPDMLLPDISPSSNHYLPLSSDFPPSTSSSTDTTEPSITKDSRKDSAPCVVNLQFSPVMMRLRNPAPPAPSRTDPLLPLPNTAALPLSAGLRMIIRANARARREARAGGGGGNAGAAGRGGGAEGDGGGTEGEGGSRIPGGLR